MDKIIDLSFVFRDKVDAPKPRDLGQHSSVKGKSSLSIEYPVSL